VTEGRLVFASGASAVTLKAGALGEDLYAATFKGQAPAVKLADGTLTVAYRLSFSDWARLALGAQKIASEFTLNELVPWSIELRRGVSKVSARLVGLDLRGLEIRGGASQVDVSLPVPRGVVPVALFGGASQVHVRCPQGSEFRVELSGGASQLTLGTQVVGAVGGKMHWETPGCALATDCFHVSVSGGASDLTIGWR
jgi:hypothetical protein